MYPTLYDAFKDLFNLELPFLQIANTFGFFVAIGFLVGNYVMTLDLRRKEQEGLVTARVKKVKVGFPLPKSDYVMNLVMGFIFGYKILPLLLDSSLLQGGAQDYIFSSRGNWWTGIFLAALLVFLKYREDKKQRLDEPEEKEIIVHPWQNMGYITLTAAVAGILGAKVFHWLENWEDFIAYPLENILSPSGLTFFGGLICGGAAVIWIAQKKGISPRKMLDVGGPAMMLVYGIGRLGCHFSGDGDWGIVNSSPKPSWLSFIPDWLWAYNYPNNVAHECDPTGGSIPCNFNVTPYLQLPVFPTPFYEALAAVVFFGLLWLLRKRIKPAGALFGIYMVLAGVERFFIEKIRVNTEYNFFGFHPTQAEIISVLMMIGGIILCIYAYRKHDQDVKVKIEP